MKEAEKFLDQNKQEKEFLNKMGAPEQNAEQYIDRLNAESMAVTGDYLKKQKKK